MSIEISIGPSSLSVASARSSTKGVRAASASGCCLAEVANKDRRSMKVVDFMVCDEEDVVSCDFR